MFILANGWLTGQQVFWNASGTGKCHDFRSILTIYATVPVCGTFDSLSRSRNEPDGMAAPDEGKRLNNRGAPVKLARLFIEPSFRGVPRLLSELRFARRRWRPRRTLAPVLVSLGHLGSLFGSQDVCDLRHHFRVGDFHFHLNLRARFRR